MFLLIMLVAFVGHLLFSFMFARRLLRSAPTWSRLKVVTLSALPLPLIVWGLCAWAAIRAAMTPALQCALEACGQTLVAATTTAIGALVLFLLGCGMAALARRPRPIPPAEALKAEFE